MYEIDEKCPRDVHVGSPLDMAAKKGHLKIFKLIQSYWWINANSIISRWRFKTEIYQANNYLILTLTLIRWKWIKVHKKCLLFSLLNKTVSLWKIIYQCNIFLSSCTVFLYFPNRKKWYYCSCKTRTTKLDGPHSEGTCQIWITESRPNSWDPNYTRGVDILDHNFLSSKNLG